MNGNKPFSLGVIVGRFQPVHVGHGRIIDTAAAVCDKVCVFVGSSQESGTAVNPLDYETRARYLRIIYGDRACVFPLPDIGVGNVPAWGEYVIKSAAERFDMPPDLFVTGREERRISWFDGAAGRKIAVLSIPKTVDITASRMREFLIADDAESWRKYTPAALWDEYAAIRAAVLASYGNTRTDSV